MQLYERIGRTDLTSGVNNWVLFSRYLSGVLAMFPVRCILLARAMFRGRMLFAVAVMGVVVVAMMVSYFP